MSGRTFLGTASVSPTPVELSQHRRSLKALTGVRFFAAVDVVILHTRLPTALIEHGYHALGTFFLNGSLAVALFFLLSGFILSYTYQGQLQKPSGFRRFWEARFARIWPVYAASLLFTSAVSLSFPKPSWILPTLLMVQAWDPVHYAMWGAWNFVCWTISAEAFFYLCFPWIQILIERLTTRRLLLLCGVLLTLIVGLNLSAFVLGYGSYIWWLDIFPRPLLRLPEFVVGMTMGCYFLQRRAASPSEATRPLLVAPGIWTYATIAAMVALMCRNSSHWTSLITVTFAALIFGLAAEETWFSRFLSTRLMILGGGISYSVYLMQDPVKDLVKVIAVASHVDSSLFRAAAMVVLLLGMSYGTFTLIEVPARDRLRAIFARLEARQG